MSFMRFMVNLSIICFANQFFLKETKLGFMPAREAAQKNTVPTACLTLHDQRILKYIFCINAKMPVRCH